MNDVYSAIAILCVLGLVLVIVLHLHRTQREMIRENAATQATTNARLKNLEEQFLGLPVTQKRMSEAVRDSIQPLNRRLNETDGKIAEIRDLLASVANKVGVVP